MNTRIAALLCATILLVAGLAAFMCRYEMTAIPAGGEGVRGSAFRMDRWTGDIRWVHEDKTGPVSYEP